MSKIFEVEFEKKVKLQKPKKFKVYLINDNQTTMDFVVDVLINIFKKAPIDANQLMLDIHNKGRGLCGIYSYEIAKTKEIEVKQYAKAEGFPLKATIEEE